MKNNMVGDFGGRLEKVRLALGMKKQEMASAAGINPAYLSEVINGKKSNPGIAFAAKIAAHFRVNLNYLLLEEGEMFLPGKKEGLNEEIDAFKDCNDIDDVYWLMKKSSYIRNMLLAYAYKLYQDNEAIIKKEIKMRAKQAEKKDDE